MVNIKLKRFSRSKEQLPEETQPEPQPDSPSYLQSEPQIKTQRGRPKRNKIEDIQVSQTQEPEPQPQPQQSQPQTEQVNYDDLTNDNFLDDLNNVHYKEEVEEPKQKIKDVKSNKKESSFSLDSNKLLDKIKKGSSSSSLSFSLDSHSLLDGSFEEGQEHDHDHNHDDFGNHKKVEEKKSKIELKNPKENQEKCKKFILLFIL